MGGNLTRWDRAPPVQLNGLLSQWSLYEAKFVISSTPKYLELIDTGRKFLIGGTKYVEAIGTEKNIVNGYPVRMSHKSTPPNMVTMATVYAAPSVDYWGALEMLWVFAVGDNFQDPHTHFFEAFYEFGQDGKQTMSLRGEFAPQPPQGEVNPTSAFNHDNVKAKLDELAKSITSENKKKNSHGRHRHMVSERVEGGRQDDVSIQSESWLSFQEQDSTC